MRRDDTGIRRDDTGMRRDDTGMRRDDTGIRRDDTGVRLLRIFSIYHTKRRQVLEGSNLHLCRGAGKLLARPTS